MTMVPSQISLITTKRQQQEKRHHHHINSNLDLDLLLLHHHHNQASPYENQQYQDQEEEEEDQYCTMSQTGGTNNSEKYYYCSAGESDIVIGPMDDQHQEATASSNNSKEAASIPPPHLQEENKNDEDEEEEEEEEGGSWLRLSIGSTSRTSKSISSQPAAARISTAENLFPGGVSSRRTVIEGQESTFVGTSSNNNSSTVPLMMYYHQFHHQQFQDPIINWAGLMRPLVPPQPQPNIASSSSFLTPNRQFHRAPPFSAAMASTSGGGAGFDFRVVSPPRRPHSGIWFTLQASQSQTRQPFLPQISKSFLRIKDGRMTIRLVLKYLVNKLRMESESEIEITCRGQQLAPLMTLQHVRDNIWGQTLTWLQDSSPTDHLMVLLYSRTP